MTDEKTNGSYPFIKVFPEEYMGGSLHYGCTLEERGFFVDLLCLAAKNRKERGTLSLEKGIPMTDEMIANALFINPVDCQRLLGVMFTQDRIERRKDGVILITNFDYYQRVYRRSKKSMAIEGKVKSSSSMPEKPSNGDPDKYVKGKYGHRVQRYPGKRGGDKQGKDRG